MSQLPTIPLIDLVAAHAELREELEAAATRVLRSGWYVLGEEVAAFEAEFAAWLGLEPGTAVGVGSGTAALHLALLACQVGPGDEVVVPSHTAVATVAAVCLAGARPIFADVQPVTLTLDPASVREVLSSRTRAIVPVHLYGQTADMESLTDLAHQHDLWLIEDCAQAHGARRHGRLAGTMGDIGCFSFYPTKNLGAAGDGGLVVSHHPQLADRLRLLRQYGWRERYVSAIPGLNSRLDELQAALLRVKLRHLNDWNRRRQRLAHLYNRLLAGCGVSPPEVAAGNEHVYHLYVVRLPDQRTREHVQAILAQQGIATAVHYPLPVHRQPAYRHLAPPPGALAVTEQTAGQILTLPLYPQMPSDSVQRIAEALCRALQAPPNPPA